MPTQRFVIEVERESEEEEDSGWNMWGGGAATPTPDHGDVTHGGEDEETKSAGADSNRQTSTRGGGRTRGKRSGAGGAREQISVTFILTNSNDSNLLRVLFKEALEEDED